MKGDFSVGEWTIQPESNIAVGPGNIARLLTSKSMKVLTYLAAHPGEVLSREEITRAVWPESPDADHALTEVVSRLRRVLQDDPKQPRYIQTDPRKGYCLIAPVASLKESGSRYRMIRKLGQGAMGEVFLAHDTELFRPVALKFLLGEEGQDEKPEERLMREARAAAALDHPFICKIYETGLIHGKTFIAMEYVEGENLRQRLGKGRLGAAEVLQTATEIAEAMEAAHRKGIIHRDLKPSNIMLAAQGHLKVMDFGLARFSRRPTGELEGSSASTSDSDTSEGGGIAGTVAYMSPEQVRGEILDARSDIFSFGIMLYEMCAGQHPFQRLNRPTTVHAILTLEPEPVGARVLQCPAGMQRVISRCLAKSRDDRFPSAADLLAALRELSEDMGLAVARKARKPSVAVLPFSSLQVGPEMDFFSDGMTNDITTKLAKLKNLLVISSTSVMRFKGSGLDVRQIGRELGVSAVLEGGVRKHGYRYKINAQLINVEDGFHLWADAYDIALEDVFEVQDRVSGEIARALSVQLPPGEAPTKSQAPTANLEAYGNYLRGKHFYYKFSDTDNRLAMEAFNRAISLDPDYAWAYAGLAMAYVARVERGWDGAVGEWTHRAMEAAERAIGLNPAISEPYAARSLIYFWQKRLDEARSEISRALAIDPNDDIAHNVLGRIHFQQGEFARAVSEFEQALQVNPYYVWCLNDLAWAQSLLGRCEETRKTLARVLQINPQDEGAYMGISWLDYFAGDLEEALQAIQRSIELNPHYPFSRSVHAVILARKGRFEEALDVCRQPARSELEDFMGKATLGVVHLEQGDLESVRLANECALARQPFYTPLNLTFALYYAHLNNEFWAREWLRKFFAEGTRSREILKQNPLLRQFDE